MEVGLQYMKRKILNLIMETEGDFLTDKTSILSELTSSKIYQTCVGLSSKKLGTGMFITVVEQIIIDENSTTIVLKQYDATGYLLPTNKLELDDITSLFPFKSKFNNPYLEHIKQQDEIYPTTLFRSEIQGPEPI